MDEELFDKYIRIIEVITGLTSPEANYSQIRRTVRSYEKKTGFDEEKLLSRLWIDGKLQESFLNDVLIGETYFFREVRHFHVLRSEILPELRSSYSSLKAWSPSCSTGEETVSLAMILQSFCSACNCCDFTVYATDINSKALARLREGTYPYSALRQDGKSLHEELLSRYSLEKGEYTFEVDPKLLSKIEIRRANFFSDPAESLPEGVHVLFFRNTLIYFSKKRRETLIDRLVSRMAPGGYLFLSSGEIPFVAHRELELREYADGHVLRKLGAGNGRNGSGIRSVNDSSTSMLSGGA